MKGEKKSHPDTVYWNSYFCLLFCVFFFWRFRLFGFNEGTGTTERYLMFCASLSRPLKWDALNGASKGTCSFDVEKLAGCVQLISLWCSLSAIIVSSRRIWIHLSTNKCLPREIWDGLNWIMLNKMTFYPLLYFTSLLFFVGFFLFFPPAFITFFTLFLQHSQTDWINFIMPVSLPLIHLSEAKKRCDPFSQSSDLALALEVNKNWVNLWKRC